MPITALNVNRQRLPQPVLVVQFRVTVADLERNAGNSRRRCTMPTNDIVDFRSTDSTTLDRNGGINLQQVSPAH